MKTNLPSAFRLEIGPDHVATLTFDQPGCSANVFTEATLRELDTQLLAIESTPGLAGLILTSGKPGIFIAGADLQTLANARGSELADLITLGQNVFHRLASLPIPTVAAIDGACAGGGCELALACDWRLASDSDRTRLGLPETQLGIIPAWGGTTSLPALLGLPAALSLILGGSLLKPGAALHKGLVDEVVPCECLPTRARAFLARGKRSVRRRPLLHNRLSASLIRARSRAALRSRTRGHYPALFTALEVASRSVSTTKRQSQHNEREAILDLAPRPETANLMRLFFLSEHARKLRVPDTTPLEVKRTAVIGAGVMGSGIAYWLSTRGFPVVLQDLSPAALARGMQQIGNLYSKAVKRHVLTAVEAARGLDRIVPTAEPVPLHRIDLVIEAATEDLDVKRRIFAALATRTGLHTILATNTSALPIAGIAAGLSIADRLVGLHFFNPVHRMKLIEVVRSARTSDHTLATALRFVQRLGKLPVVVADRPGFLVNRILMPYLVQAATRFAHGGDPVAIDRAMLDFGMPMGPLRLLDEVGLDVALDVARTLRTAFPDRVPMPAIIESMVSKGLLGVKSGAGFYSYDNRGPRPNPDAQALRDATEPLPDDLGTRLAFAMVAEARRCLEEDVASSPDEIDLAMVLGTGFPPFRGGPLRYAAEAGLFEPLPTPEAFPLDFPDLQSSPAA